MMTSTCSLELFPSRSLAFLEPASAGAAVMRANTRAQVQASCKMRGARLPHMALKIATRLRFDLLPLIDPFERTPVNSAGSHCSPRASQANGDIRRVFKVLREISLLHGQDTLSRRIPCS